MCGNSDQSGFLKGRFIGDNIRLIDGLINHTGRVFTTPIVSLNIPECALFTGIVKRLKNDRCFHE